MSTLSVSNMEGKTVGTLTLADELLSTKKGGQALHETLVAYRANQRAGTASTKTKGEVAGSNKKPWKQKGTGRARAGYRQSPIWRGGGVVFGPKPRSYRKKVPRKTGRLAFRRAFSDKVAAGDVVVLDRFELAEPKTRLFVAALKNLNIARGALLVLDTVAREVALASRNVPDVEVVTAQALNPYQMLRYRKLVITQRAMSQLETRLRGETEAA